MRRARLIPAIATIAFAATTASARPGGPPPSARPPGKSSDASSTPAKAEKAKKSPIEVATLGAGCFWSIEAVFERVPGVTSVVSGYSGGVVANPSYAQVCTGTTGHAEVVHVTFDNRIVSYETLLKLYWKAHDPTTPNAQGLDHGPQYRSIIFYHSDEQKDSALKIYKDLKEKRVYRAPIVTQLEKFETFYPAEPYHQDYFRNNPASDYSQLHIVPKIWKLKLKAR